MTPPVPETAARVARPATGRHLLRFAILCAALSFLPWAILWALRLDVNDGAGSLVFGLAASGPSLAALVMWLRYRRSRIHAGVRATWTWPVAAIGFGAAPVALAAVCLNAAHLASIPAHATSVVAGVGGPLGALAYTLVSGPLSEEFGWRGYVQPRLRQRRGRLATTGLIGTAWGLWHVPLFFLPGTGQHDMGLFSAKGLLFFVALYPLSYTMLYVSEHLRGGVWAAILLHASWNLSDALVPPYGAAGAVLQTGLMVAVAGGVAFAWHRSAGRGRHAGGHGPAARTLPATPAPVAARRG